MTKIFIVNNMKFIKLLPFDSILDDDPIDCALWQSEDNLCEFQMHNPALAGQARVGNCDNSGFYYGTSDEDEPKFCAKHFYQQVVNGDGKSNYKLEDKKNG